MDTGNLDVVAGSERFDFAALVGRDVENRFRDGEGSDFDGVVAGFGGERKSVIERPALENLVADRELHGFRLTVRVQMSSGD
jgi:hypothetical protein